MIHPLSPAPRLCLCLLLSFFSLCGCNDATEKYPFPDASENQVQVSLRIGFGEEAGLLPFPDVTSSSTAGSTEASAPASGSGSGSESPSAKETAAFRITSSPSLVAKGGTPSLVPDQLYNLEIQQYDGSGNRIGGMNTAVTEAPGSRLALPLVVSADCQLVIVAWGEGRTTRLGSASLQTVQTNLTVPAAEIAPLDPTVQADMNKMPYVLHLEHVSVGSDGAGGGTLTSAVPGAGLDNAGFDVRLILQRLAVRLEMEWNYDVPDYNLSQVLLQSIPMDYHVVADPDASDQSYPSLLDQFTTIQLTGAQLAAGRYAGWVPANVRGRNPAATSMAYRTKQTAPIGSSYVSFLAVHTSNVKKKLDYRVYLGGRESADFNLRPNTDYRYTLRFDHTALPVNDKRVTIIDPIPASENNQNLVPTANSFMVSPGGAFCFDPFLYEQNGRSITNTKLKNWADAEGGIAYVRLLWQTKENGDVGDPVMGIVNAPDDHTNIVEIKKNDGSEVSKLSPAVGPGDARIYCRVASGTTGGSGLIAAYNAADEILWSWHVWVTEYNPDPLGDQTLLQPAAKRKLKYAYSSTGRVSLPMMDRNLGAMEGYVDQVPADALAMSKANGMHYQWGRKDPFISSYSREVIASVDNVLSATPPKGLLNRYGPDGIQFVKNESSTITVERDLFKNPGVFSTEYSSSSWLNGALWNETGNVKSYADPCPAGWRVVGYEDLYSLFSSGSANPDNDGDKIVDANIANADRIGQDGGAAVYFEGKGSGHTCYFRLTGYWRFENSFQYIGQQCNMWTRRWKRSPVSTAFIFIYDDATHRITGFTLKTREVRDAHTTRCIQEKAF